jgi:hypothetical protein
VSSVGVNSSTSLRSRVVDEHTVGEGRISSVDGNSSTITRTIPVLQRDPVISKAPFVTTNILPFP